jgi:hypothetical protein
LSILTAVSRLEGKRQAISSPHQPGKEDALQPTTTATSVRVRDGKTITTDGPFAETKEQLGGFYLIEASNLDEAISTASRIPSARFGTIEVRPIWTIE